MEKLLSASWSFAFGHAEAEPSCLQVAESFEIGQYLQMANTVQRNLELTQSATTGRKQGSLFGF